MAIDSAFYIILIFAAVKGFRKGLIVALFSFLAFFVGLAAALKLSVLAAEYLSTSGFSGRFLPFFSFVLVFVAVALLVNLLARVLKGMAGMAMLGWVDKLGGVLFYVILYSLMFSIMLFFGEKTGLLTQSTIESSKVYNWVAPIGPVTMDSLGTIIPVFKGMFQELQNFFEQAGNQVLA